jgi:hypothetical protein
MGDVSTDGLAVLSVTRFQYWMGRVTFSAFFYPPENKKRPGAFTLERGKRRAFDLRISYSTVKAREPELANQTYCIAAH